MCRFPGFTCCRFYIVEPRETGRDGQLFPIFISLGVGVGIGIGFDQDFKFRALDFPRPGHGGRTGGTPLFFCCADSQGSGSGIAFAFTLGCKSHAWGLPFIPTCGREPRFPRYFSLIGREYQGRNLIRISHLVVLSYDVSSTTLQYGSGSPFCRTFWSGLIDDFSGGVNFYAG